MQGNHALESKHRRGASNRERVPAARHVRDVAEAGHGLQAHGGELRSKPVRRPRDHDEPVLGDIAGKAGRLLHPGSIGTLRTRRRQQQKPGDTGRAGRPWRGEAMVSSGAMDEYVGDRTVRVEQLQR
jgi:hypothetical protein